MSAIGPGDFVEVIGGSGKQIPVGAIVLVSEVRASEAWQCATEAGCEFGVRLSAAPNPPDGRFWCGCCFRPIYRPKASLIESLKTPAPATEDA